MARRRRKRSPITRQISSAEAKSAIDIAFEGTEAGILMGTYSR